MLEHVIVDALQPHLEFQVDATGAVNQFSAEVSISSFLRFQRCRMTTHYPRGVAWNF